MHDFFVSILPEREQDFILLSLRFREAMPKELRKFLLGPIVADGGNRSFIFLPCNGIKIEGHRENFIKFMKSIPTARYAHIQFGDGITNISSSDSATSDAQSQQFFAQQMKALEEEWNSRETDLLEEIKELIDRKADVETMLNLVKSERDEAVAFRNKDTVLAKAVEELKSLRGKKPIIEAAQKVAEEFKDKPDAPASVKSLLEVLCAKPT